MLPPGKIAVVVLAVLHHDQRLADMAGGDDVSESTLRRWRDERIGLLAVQAPGLDRACERSPSRAGRWSLLGKPAGSGSPLVLDG